MRRLGSAIAGLLAAGLFVGTAQAGPYGMAGCGLGSIVIHEDGFIQILVATINGTFASQTFGISTGTSNCTRGGVVLADKEQEAFFESNFAELKRDIASGGGEYLAGLSQLFSCDSKVLPLMSERAQKSYDTVFPNEQTTPQQALYILKLQLSQDDAIAGACIL